jgi:hypothetical protein
MFFQFRFENNYNKTRREGTKNYLLVISRNTKQTNKFRYNIN